MFVFRKKELHVTLWWWWRYAHYLLSQNKYALNILTCMCIHVYLTSCGRKIMPSYALCFISFAFISPEIYLSTQYVRVYWMPNFLQFREINFVPVLVFIWQDRLWDFTQWSQVHGFVHPNNDYKTIIKCHRKQIFAFVTLNRCSLSIWKRKIKVVCSFQVYRIINLSCMNFLLKLLCHTV